MTYAWTEFILKNNDVQIVLNWLQSIGFHSRASNVFSHNSLIYYKQNDTVILLPDEVVCFSMCSLKTIYLYSTDYHAAMTGDCLNKTKNCSFSLIQAPMKHQLEEYVLKVERMARTTKWCWVKTAQQNLPISTNFCCCQCHFLSFRVWTNTSAQNECHWIVCSLADFG